MSSVVAARRGVGFETLHEAIGAERPGIQGSGLRITPGTEVKTTNFVLSNTEFDDSTTLALPIRYYL